MFPTTVNASPGVAPEPIWTFPATVKLPIPAPLASTDVVPPCDWNSKQPFEPNPIEPDLFEPSSNLINSVIPLPVLAKAAEIYFICRWVADEPSPIATLP